MILKEDLNFQLIFGNDLFFIPTVTFCIFFCYYYKKKGYF